MTTPGRLKVAPKNNSKHHIPHRNFVIVGVFLLLFSLLYVILPAIGTFNDTYTVLRHAYLRELIWAFVATAGTYVFAALTYQLLALHPLLYVRTVIMQIASSFANRILPAGSGGLALNVQYLRKSGHNTTEAGVVAAVNNSLGFVANIALVAALLVINDHSIRITFSAVALRNAAFYSVLAAVAVIVGLVFAHRFINLSRYVRPVAKSFSYYNRRPQKIVWAVLTSAVVCSMYTLTLYFVAQSLGVDLTFTQALLAMTLSTIGTVLIPTPGGIGGAEAGVVSALAALHIDPSVSLAVALLYRIFTFWLPLIAGAGVFKYSLRYLR